MQGTLPTPEIDATDCIRALDINHPVRFEWMDLAQKYLGLTTVAMSRQMGFTLNGKAADLDLVELDLDAMAISGASIEATIAHELVHIKQMQDLGGSYVEFEQEYIRAGSLPTILQALADPYRSVAQYRRNPYEAQAYAWQDRLAPLVRLSWPE